jgi:small subunit ribosomal protein S7
LVLSNRKILLFNRWDCTGIEVKDEGLKRYISFPPRLIPHSGGRHEHKRFHKANLHIVERFVNKLMSPGRNNGKKMLVMNAVKYAFEMIEIRSGGQNPVQMLVNAVANAAPREETTRISYGGIVFHSAVDSAPLRRVDIGLNLIAQSIKSEAFNSLKSFEELITDQIMLTASNDTRSYAVKRKQDIERVALAAR